MFVLTATMFTVVALTVNRQSKFNLAPASTAFPPMMSALKHLIPYALVIAAVYAFSNLTADLLYGVLNPRIRLS